MKTIVMFAAVIVSLMYISVAQACVPPDQPVPPVGCTSANAYLVSMSDGSCVWYFIGCNE